VLANNMLLKNTSSHLNPIQITVYLEIGKSNNFMGTIISKKKSNNLRENFRNMLHKFFNFFTINENRKSIAFVRNLSRLYCTQYNTTLHVSAIRPSSGVSCIYKNAKIILKLNGSVNLVSKLFSLNRGSTG
jgi:hypothetical protein